jgi:hypothetical protein
MNDITIKLINLSYLFLSFFIIKRLDLPILRGSIHTYAWAVIFIASVFFALGLLLFNIPLGFFGMSSPQALERIKEIWWVAPLFPFTCLIISLTLRVLILKIKQTNKS